MQVNEEIDALRTTGVSPIDFLVFPCSRPGADDAASLSLCGPDGNSRWARRRGFVLNLNVQILHGDDKGSGACRCLDRPFFGSVYGILVAVAACLRGMQCGRSAYAVGDATTSAVVTSIVSIVVATAIITVLCDILGI